MKLPSLKQVILIPVLLLLTFPAFSQIVFNASHHDFGEVDTEDKKYFDFTLTNAGTKKAFLLRIEESYGIDAKYSKKEILPDSTIIIRIKYTPKKKGKFKVDVPVWVSVNTQPIVLTVEGYANTFDVNESLDCPDFSATKKPKELISDLKIKVIDSDTKQPITDAQVQVIWDGLMYKKIPTNYAGEVLQPLNWDIYYFVVNANKYATGEVDFYVNENNKYLEIELTKLTQEELTEVEIDAIPTEPIVEEVMEVVEEVVVEEIEEVIEEPIAVVEVKDTISTKELPVGLYAPNNVVFLIDVSVSMKQKGRLDLLKASMIELLNGLRPIDKLAIVTYASSTEVVMPSEYVTDKAKAIKIIQDLKAGGYTAGAKGIKKAFEVARDNKIEGGNNQVILATDGAFNLESKDKIILKNVASNLKRGVTISVVGVKNEKWTVKSMSSIAKAGDGHYIHIKAYEQAKGVLMDEIKLNSKRK